MQRLFIFHPLLIAQRTAVLVHGGESKGLSESKEQNSVGSFSFMRFLRDFFLSKIDLTGNQRHEHCCRTLCGWSIPLGKGPRASGLQVHPLRVEAFLLAFSTWQEPQRGGIPPVVLGPTRMIDCHTECLLGWCDPT